MKGIDKYIFAFLLIASLTMIFASCKQTNSEEDAVLQQNSKTETEKTYTSEGTISTGTKDTMNQHTNGVDNSKMDNTEGEVPVKGEIPPARN